MNCTACGHAISEGVKFCSQCGTQVVRACGSCGYELRPHTRFCERCGTAAPEFASPSSDTAEQAESAVRKTVTVLFADLAGSTALGEQVDAESTRDVLADYHAMARAVIEEHGGFLAKFIGDGVMALFGVPETAEDDAIRATAAGVALQLGFDPLREIVADRHSAELGLRVGINTGEVVIAAGDDDVVGDALNTAARLESACAAGQVLVGEDTWRLARSAFDFDALGSVLVKGKVEPIATYQVVAAGEGDDDLVTPFVGRARELTRVREVFDRAVADRIARLTTVIGSPGVGKTRLSREFGLAVGDVATVVEMRCRRSGTTTFAPVAELLRAAADIGDEDAPDDVLAAVHRLVDDLDDADRVSELLAGFVGVGPDRSTEEAFFAVRRLIESQARRKPIVLVVDDVQWAEPLFLDLLEHLVEWIDDAPTLIVALARPEIREIRPTLAAESRTVQAAISLEGLDAAATAELAARLVGTSSLPSELIGRLPESTEGNPLFVRELMRMLVDDGVIVESDGTWELTIEAEAVEVPPTIQSLLSARLDRMPSDERKLVELASVVGSEFPLGALQEISEPGTDGARLRGAMDRLRRRELVETTGRYWGDEPVFRFHHVLIRDAAYRRLLKRRRAELHGRVGEWTERTAADLPGEHEAAISYHFEQAYAYRRELSDLGDETLVLGRRAADLLRTAAHRALDRDDIAAAGALAERALACLDPGDPATPELLMLGCEALLGLGDVARGGALVDALGDLDGDAGQRAWTTCFSAQRAVLTEPGTLHEVLRRLETAAEDLAGLGDDAGVAKARLVRAGALARLGRIGESESELDLALTAARAADDRRRVAAVLGVAPVAALWGPSPIPRAGGRCLDVIRLLRITTGSPSVEAVSTRCQAVLEALRGRFDTARTMLSEARATVEELGLRHELLETQLYTGIVELLAGEPANAESSLRDAYEGLADLGIDADAGQAAAHLARALLRRGRVDEAGELAGAGDALAGRTPQTGIVARAVQAEVLAAQGHPEQAVRLAREAVEIASLTDLVIDHADASAVLAAVTSDPAESAAARDAAKALYEGKAATVPADLTAPQPSDSTPSEPTRVDAGRIDSPTASATSPPPIAESDAWNCAAAIHERHLALTVSGRFEESLNFLAESIVVDDRRDAVGAQFEGKANFRASYGQFAQDADFSSAQTIAVRGENLALRRCRVTAEGDWTIEFLGVYRLGANDLIEHIVVFDADDLAAAIDELYQQRKTDLVAKGDLQALLDHHMVEAHREAIVDRDIDRYFSAQDPNGEIIDHRPVGWGTLSVRDSHERLATLRDLPGDLETYVARFVRHERDVTLIDQVLRSTNAQGGLSEERSLFVARQRAGLNSRIEQFHVNQLDDALRVFEEQLALAEADSGPANTASMVGDALHASIAAWGRLRPEVVATECGVINSTGAILTRDLGSITDADDLRSLGIGVTTHRTLSVFYEHIALVELRDDDIGGAPFHRLAVEEIDERAQLRAVTLYEPTIEGLRSAEALINERVDAIQPPDAAISFIRRLQALRNSPELRTIISPSFGLVDHRKLGFGTLDADGFVELREASSELPTSEISFPQGFSLSNDRGSVTRIATLAVRPNGELDEGAPMFLVVIIDAGRMTRLEFFDEHDKDAAVARFEELTREPDRDEHVPWNRADAWCRKSWTSYVARDHAAWLAHLGDDISIDDRRPLVGRDSESRKGTDERMWRISDSPISEAPLTTLAARGERLVLQHHLVRTDDGNSWDLLAVYQLGQNGLIARMVAFEGDDLASAVDELDRMFLDNANSPFEAYAVRYQKSSHDAFRAHDTDALNAKAAPSDARVDHRPLGFGEMGWAGLTQLHEARAGLGRDIFAYMTRLHLCGYHRLCFEVCFIYTASDGGSYETRAIVVEDVDRSRENNLSHMFGPDQLDEALALAGEPREESANAASAIFGALHMWERLGRPIVHDPYFADGFVVFDGDTGASISGEAEVRGGDPPAWLDASRRVLGTVDDHSSVVLLDADTSAGDRWFAIERVDTAGALASLALYEPSHGGLTRAFDLLTSEFGRTAETARVVDAGIEFVAAHHAHDLDRLDSLLAPDFAYSDRRGIGYPTTDRAAFLQMTGEVFEVGGTAVLTEESRIRLNSRGFVTRNRQFYVGDDGEVAESTPSLGVMALRGGQLIAFEQFPAHEEDAAIARFEELTGSNARAAASTPVFDSLACRVDQQMLVAMNDGTLLDRLDEFFMPDFHRVDHRSIVGGGVLDAATTTAMAESMVALAGRVRTEPIVTRGDLLALSRGITVYGSAAESAYLMGSEVDASARQARIDVFDEDALDEAMAELNRRWLDSLSPTEQETVGVAARWAQASRAPWDLEAFDELLEEEFEAHDGSRLGAGRLDREQFLSSQRARAELQGRADETTIDLMELPRPDVLLSRLRSTGTGSRWDTDWETRWIVVHQVAGDHVRRFGLFDDTDLDGARDWAAALGPETDEESRFDTLSTRVAACFRAAMNDGSVAERLDEFFEPDWRRVDHRSVIGTGELDATTFAEILATVDFETRSTHLAVRGDLLLLSRGTTNYGVDRESSFLVLSEIGPEGRQRRSDLYDEDAFDEAITEMDRLWRRTLTDEERTTLRVTGEFGRAFMEQDHAVFDRILHPNFTSMEHGVFQGGELDRAAWEPMNRDRNDVFGRGRLFIDIVELPSPHVVLSRTTQTGTSEGGMAWEVAEWTVLQMADGKIVRAEVLDADPEIAQADRARRIAGELVEQDTRSAFGNRAVHIASVIAAAWNAGDSGSRFFTVDFVWLDRRSAEPDPDDPRADLLSVVLSGQPGPTGLAASERHCEIGDVLLACDESFALVPLRIAFDLGGAERGGLMAVACDDDGQLARAAVFGPDQEDAARRELTLWWAAALQPRRMEVSQLAVAFGESWVAPTSRPLGDMMAPDFRLVDGRTLGLGDLDREGFIQALVGREEDGTTGPPLPSRVEFVSDDVLVFRAANRGVTPGTGVEWEEIACNVLVTDGPAVQRVEMFDENQWDAAVARAREIAEGAYHRSSSGPINPDQTVDSPSTPPSH